MEIKAVKTVFPEGSNIILAQAHFIKTIDDIYEIIRASVPDARFGAAFCEASGPCLIRVEGNDETLKKYAADNAASIGAGHLIVIILTEAFPINILNAVKGCQEVCSVFCATANPIEVIVAETETGRAVLGVVDGSGPKGVEGEKERKERKEFLRKIGYKA